MADKNKSVLEAFEIELRYLRKLNDEQIAARRGEMHKWVRVEDVQAALQRAQEQVGEGQ